MNNRKVLQKNLISNLLFFLILIAGAVIRLKGIFENSFAYTYDVGRDLLALRAIVVDHNVPFIGPTTGLPGLFYGPWWYYILTPSFILGNGNPQAVAGFIVLVGLVTVVLGYYFGKKLYSPSVGLVIAGLLSFSPIMLGLTTQIWNPNIAPFITLLLFVFIYVVLRYEEKKEKKVAVWHFFFIGILLQLALDAQVVYGVLLSGSVVLGGILFLGRSLSFKTVSAFIAGTVLILSPRIFFELKHNFLMTNSVLSAFTGTFPGGSELSIPERVIPRVIVLWDLWKDTVGVGNDILAFLLVMLIFFGLLRGWGKSEKSLRTFVKILAFTILIFYIGLLGFGHDIWSHYIVGLPVVFILFIGIGLAFFHIAFPKFKTIILIGAGVIVIANMNPVRLIDDFRGPIWEGDVSVYRNNLAVIDYVYTEANGKPFKYIVYTPPLHDYTYQYLFQWYGQKQFGYTPDNNEDSLFFVILEPDTQYPFRLINWLEQRKGDGKVIKTQKFKSGIIVQTRIN